MACGALGSGVRLAFKIFVVVQALRHGAVPGAVLYGGVALVPAGTGAQHQADVIQSQGRGVVEKNVSGFSPARQTVRRNGGVP